MSEIALFFGLASQRLRARCRWAGPALMLAFFVPYEVLDGRPLFLWQILGELPAAGVVAALAPTLAGAVITLAGHLERVVRRGASLALTVLASLVAAAALLRMGADAAAWDVLPVPQSFTERPTPVIAALALTAAGAHLAWKPHARPVARALLHGAVGVAALFYVWPARGEAPIATALRTLTSIVDMPHWRFMLGALIQATFALWPAIVTVLGLTCAYRPPKREQPGIGVLALYGLPGMLLMLVYRSLLGAVPGAHLLGALGSVVILAAILALLASAIEVLGEAVVTPEIDLEQPSGLSIRASASIAFGAALVMASVQWVLARPPAKGVAWSPGVATPEGDRLFGALIPAWNAARVRWGAEGRRGSEGADPEGAARVEAAVRAMLDAAQPLDEGLGGALGALATEAAALDIAGRRWYRLIGDVNEASRRAGLPYYLDPTVLMAQTANGLQRDFRVEAYRLERVRMFLVGARPYATLHVERLGAPRGSHLRLGFSRDLQPFALVVLDETRPFEADLAAQALASPPSCGASDDAAAQEGLQRCGEALRALLERLPSGLGPAITAMTERHELQHQIDGPHLPLAGAVQRRLTGYSDESQARVNRELSAYVAEMTASDAPPLLGLIHLARFALMGRRSAEHQVAVIALSVMTDRVARRPMRGVDVSEASAAFAELAALEEDVLRARAASAWRALFGVDLPAISVSGEVAAPGRAEDAGGGGGGARGSEGAGGESGEGGAGGAGN